MPLISQPDGRLSILFLVPAFGMVLSVYWIYLDATIRGSSFPLLWVISCVSIPFVLVGYLLYRSEIGGRVEPASRRERLLGTLVVAHTFGSLVVATLLPPDPFTQLLYFPLLVVVGLLPGYVLVWRHGYARLRRRVGLVHEDEVV